MKSAVFVVLFSTLVILEVSCQERCGLLLRPTCGDNRCCALLPLLGRRCQDFGREGEKCGIGIIHCPCAEGLTCVIPRFICEVMRTTTTTTEGSTTTTTEGSTTTTTEGSTTTTEGSTTTTEGSTTTTEGSTTTTEGSTTTTEQITTT